MNNVSSSGRDLIIRINSKNILTICVTTVILLLVYSYGRYSAASNRVSDQNLTHTPYPSINNLSDCTYSKECGGIVKKTTKEECENTTCCGIGGSWAIKTKEQCQIDQQAYLQNQKRNTYVPTPPKLPDLQLPTKCVTKPDGWGNIVTDCHKGFW